jgi:hypothetical protein
MTVEDKSGWLPTKASEGKEGVTGPLGGIRLLCGACGEKYVPTEEASIGLFLGSCEDCGKRIGQDIGVPYAIKRYGKKEWWDNTCPHCHATYENIGHPRTGAIMMRTCKCEWETIQQGTTTMRIRKPPVEDKP